MTDMPRRRGYHLAPLVDEHHEPCTVADILTPDEVMERRWGVPPRREWVEADPALVALVGRLQRMVRS